MLQNNIYRYANHRPFAQLVEIWHLPYRFPLEDQLPFAAIPTFMRQSRPISVPQFCSTHVYTFRRLVDFVGPIRT